MNVLSYCCASFRGATHLASGVRPLVCPPVTWYTFPVGSLAGQDLIYLDLHGRPGDAQWYGDNDVVALNEHQVRRMDLSGVTVFAVNCYLGDTDSPMLDALLDAGARAVIGGSGENFAGENRLLGASLLGYWFRRAMEWHRPPEVALTVAKRALWLTRLWARSPAHRQATDDALAFRVFVRSL